MNFLIIRLIRKGWKWIIALLPSFQKADPQPVGETEGDDQAEPSIPQNPLGFYNNTETPQKDIQAELTTRLEKLNDEFYQIGFQEGREGKETTNDEARKIASYRVAYIKNELLVAANKELEGRIIACEAIEENCEEQETELGAIKKYHKELLDQSRLFSREFSRRLGRFYLYIGVLLVIADIPLAVELTKKGFGLETDASYPIADLFSSKFLLVLTTNWEVFVMAAGVALCTVYIKIFWDEFLASPIENAVRQYKQFRESHSDEDVESIRKKKQMRIRVKISILAFTVVMITILGVFRSETMQREIGLEMADMKRKAKAIGMTDAELAEYEPNDLRGIDIAAFIALTLAFPVIGGICMSKGISCIHNRRALERAHKNRDELRTALLNMKKNDLRNAKEGVKKMEEQKAYLESKDFEKTFTDDAFGGYLRGFASGLGDSMRDIGTDYYELAKAYRAKLAKRKVYESLTTNQMMRPSINGNGNGYDHEHTPG
ncbi:MAG: hypothetical protein AAF206_03490 [Bacteroidota bacterium]